MQKARSEWDDAKDKDDQAERGVTFSHAQRAFLDPKRVNTEDISHGQSEPRHFCIGEIGRGVITVRLTHRGNVIRIFGAGYWRKEKRI